MLRAGWELRGRDAMITGARIHTHGEVEVENGVCSGGHPLSAAAGVRLADTGPVLIFPIFPR